MCVLDLPALQTSQCWYRTHLDIGTTGHSENVMAVAMHSLQRLENRNKYLAIANRSCVSGAHNTLRASIGLNITP